jgi:uncharacterized protein YkwD
MKRKNFFKRNPWLKYIGWVALITLMLLNSNIKTFYVYRNSEEESRATLERINQYRKQYGRAKIAFDERAFELANARARDMRQYNYYDHTNPKTGTCADTIKTNFGFSNDEFVAENILGYSDFSEGFFTRFEVKPMTDTVESWLNSRGHRYNLLFENHVAGAVGCYKDKCVFLGVNHKQFGKGCHTAAEGKQHWDSAPLQPGEI